MELSWTNTQLTSLIHNTPTRTAQLRTNKQTLFCQTPELQLPRVQSTPELATNQPSLGQGSELAMNKVITDLRTPATTTLAAVAVHIRDTPVVPASRYGHHASGCIVHNQHNLQPMCSPHKIVPHAQPVLSAPTALDARTPCRQDMTSVQWPHLHMFRHKHE